MYIFVTGGTGFLGKHLVGKLAQRHENIKVLTRRYDPTLQAMGVEQVIGSIMDQDLIRNALEDVDSIYHLAGLVQRDKKYAHEMYEIHVDGTVNLFDAVRAIHEKSPKQIKKIVVASTSGTVAVSEDPDFIANDDSPYVDGVVAQWPYYLSKIYEERVIDRYLKHFHLPIVTMRPTLLLGPGDTRESSTEDVVSFLKGEIKVIPKGGLSFVDVRDAADAFILAMQVAEPGKKYLLGSVNMTLRAFFETLSTMTDISTPVEADERLIKTGATFVRRLRKALKQKESAAFDNASIEMAHHYWYLDASRAQRELSWRPRTIESTLRDTIDWIHKNHADFSDKKRGSRRTPPAAYVPRETQEYADRIRVHRDPHDR